MVRELLRRSLQWAVSSAVPQMESRLSSLESRMESVEEEQAHQRQETTWLNSRVNEWAGVKGYSKHE